MNKLHFLFVSCLFMLLSCSSYHENSSPNAANTELESAKSALSEGQTKDAEKSTAAEPVNDVKNYAERKLTKEGSISYETNNVNETKTLIEKKAKEMNGYISKEYSSDVDNRFEYTLEVRIPSTKFDDFISSISSTIVRLDNKNVQVQDVTEEYVDVDARLKTKKEVKDRYTELLKQAKNVNEMLDVEKEIGNLQSDIESMEGRLKYLSDRISLSTLTVTFYEHSDRSFAFGHKLLNGFSSGWKGFLWLIVGLVYLWPLWLILFTGLWVLVHFLKRKNTKKKQTD